MYVERCIFKEFYEFVIGGKMHFVQTESFPVFFLPFYAFFY